MNIIDGNYENTLLGRELAEFRANAAVVPPLTNRGGSSITPPSFPIKFHNQKTSIDWLSFSSPRPISELRMLITLLFDKYGPVVITDIGHGITGYPSASKILVDDVQVGIVGYGADHGKNYVSITGTGCKIWEKDFYPHVRDVVETALAKITRIDICLDFYHGELTFEDCDKAYENLEFKLSKSNKNPRKKIQGEQENGINLGRTLYVGSRKGSKYIRCYEKGLEQFSRLPEDFRISCTEPGSVVFGEKEGAPASTIADQWFRVEVEFKNADYELSFDMITETDLYFCGSNPYCEKIIGLTNGLRPKLLKKDADISVEKVFINAKKSYGTAIHSLKKCGYTDSQIIHRLDAGKVNSRMVNAGILSKHHADPLFVPF